ncbi:MAG: hypothetical protein QOC78_2428 [Solirubrobacteraceae bacterium]|jgi:hypothetical protein|nr:hypothetical protein [Solirubrobacteraceae bacterium]
MRRVAVIAALLALWAPAAARAQAPPLRATLAACTTGPDAIDRTAAFAGSMPAVPGAQRLWMRFDLRERLAPSADFVAVHAPGLDAWRKSAVGRSSGFVFTQRVQQLAAPGAYRALVRFRWYGAGGTLLRSARRLTAICRQPDWRPDLVAGLLDVAASGQPGLVSYRLMVRNDGRGDAGPFDVGLAVDGMAQEPQRVPAGIAAHARTAVTFMAPACAPGSTLRFTLDAQAEVAEAGEADDVVDRPCPLGP